MSGFHYRGQGVIISHHADIQRQFRPNGIFADKVQEVLDGIEPWKAGEDPVETVRFDGANIYPMAIPSEGRDVVWGIHQGHQARVPQISPFVTGFTRVPRRLVGFVTVELTGTAEKPIITRAYGGEYTPPLPWMSSAKASLDGKQACAEYWRRHAYRDIRNVLIQPGSRTKTPPDWYAA